MQSDERFERVAKNSAENLSPDFQYYLIEKPAEAGLITALRASLIVSKRFSTALLLLCRSKLNFRPWKVGFLP